MPASYTYPGVYVEEIPSGVHTITGVSTSDTAFVDFFPRGPIDRAVRIIGFDNFVQEFGGFDQRSEASYAIYQYFLNGGSVAWVVRVVAHNAMIATRSLVASIPGAAYGYGYGMGQFMNVFKVSAISPGEWGNRLQVAVDYKGTRRLLDDQGQPIENKPLEFNLVVREVIEINGRAQVVQSEVFRNLHPNKENMRYAENVVNNESRLIRLKDMGAGEDLPERNGADVISDPDSAEFLWLGQDGYWAKDLNKDEPPRTQKAKPEWKDKVEYQGGKDGFVPGTQNWNTVEGVNALLGKSLPEKPAQNSGIYLLDTIAPLIFNILCIPALAKFSKDSRRTALAAASAFCEEKRAFFIVDLPSEISNLDKMIEYISGGGSELPGTNHAAVYYPRLRMPDPINENRPREVGSSGTIAGIYASTDARRGVWKAPAGTEATLQGIELMDVLNDKNNGALNPLGANVLRNFPIFRNVVWGARTLEGADQRASEWKYIPVRRTALFIEESLYQGLKWVVFEPNDEPLWASIRLNVGAFMHDLFVQGAFQGKTPRDAYFVKCDKESTTQNDINKGIVNIIVGFAPLKPAEFVVIKLQQMAGQIQV